MQTRTHFSALCYRVNNTLSAAPYFRQIASSNLLFTMAPFIGMVIPLLVVHWQGACNPLCY